MKKLILLTVLALCLFVGMTVSAADYIVELTVPLSDTGIAETESFREIVNPVSYLYVTDNLELIKQLEEMDMVVYYEEDIPVTLNASYAEKFDERYATYAGFTNNLASRDTAKGEYTVRVGVIDSGIAIYDADGNVRSDFANVTAGKSFVDSEPYKDTTNHGTPAAGLIGGKFSGVAPDCEMISLKAFNSTSGSISMIVDAIYAGINDYGCKVLNISAIASGYNTTFKNAVNYALNNNVIIVSAVGNDGTTTSAVGYPAGFDGVIGVGSVSNKGVHSTFSRVNGSNDVCAIGESVYTTMSYSVKSNYYGYSSGTSFSAPQVAGLAALLCSYDYDMTPDEFLKILEATSFDPGESGYDTTYGHGIIDVKEALEFVIKQPQVYSSRIFNSGNNVNYKIYNNTSSAKTITVITANYDLFGRIISYEPTVVTVNSKTATALSDEITCNFSQGEFFRVMVWQSFEKMMPLYKVRDYVQ